MKKINTEHEMNILEGLHEYLMWLIGEHPELSEEIEAAYQQWAALSDELLQKGSGSRAHHTETPAGK